MKGQTGMDQIHTDWEQMGRYLNGALPEWERSLTALARVDFDRAKSLADRWQRSEAQLKARLMIVQTVLSNTSFIAESSMKPQN